MTGPPDAASQALQALLEAAAEAGARKALEQHAAAEPGTLVPIKSAPVSYRALLQAEKDKELRIYRRGKSAFVERGELERWIKSAPVKCRPEPAEPKDEVAEILEFNDRRRRRGGR